MDEPGEAEDRLTHGEVLIVIMNAEKHINHSRSRTRKTPTSRVNNTVSISYNTWSQYTPLVRIISALVIFQNIPDSLAGFFVAKDFCHLLKSAHKAMKSFLSPWIMLN